MSDTDQPTDGGATPLRTSDQGSGHFEPSGEVIEPDPVSPVEQAAAEPPVDADTPSLDEMTRDELYEQAQRLDIEGRSSMSKDELATAIRNHQR